MTKKKRETSKQRDARRAGHSAAFEKEVELLSQVERDQAIREVDELEKLDVARLAVSREADDPPNTMQLPLLSQHTNLGPPSHHTPCRPMTIMLSAEPMLGSADQKCSPASPTYRALCRDCCALNTASRLLTFTAGSTICPCAKHLKASTSATLSKWHSM